MKFINNFIISKRLNFYKFFIIYFFFFHYYDCITDFDYHQKLRLNNGNYLIMSTQGIYIYNEEFNKKKTIVLFESRLLDSNNDIFKVDIAQFLSEDNGYILCLIKNETYILSKNTSLLYHTTLNYIKKYNFYQIIPYGHLNNEYYFVIITIDDDAIVIREYIYDSIMNQIFYQDSHIYSINTIHNDGISCILMIYSDNKVITCFFNQEKKINYKVFNISNFEIINGFEGQIPIELTYNGAYLVSSVINEKREKAICCSIYYGNLQCFGYNIKNNEFTSNDTITPSINYCKDEFINLQLEYFPETDEFLFGCKGEGNYFYIGKYSSDFNLTNYGKIDIEIPSGCESPNSFHFIYSSNVEKYSLLVDMGECVNERIINLNTIQSQKISDFPTDEMGILICDKYYNYDLTNCLESIPEGFYCNNSIQKTIDKCHDDCLSCDKGPTFNFSNCNKCKNDKYLEFGNCVYSCENNKTVIDPNDNTNLICKCNKNIKCLICTPESLENNLCISCNQDEGYYPKANDNNLFINCYNYDTIPKDYFFNNITKQYEEKNCSINYFYDIYGNYHCIENDSCPYEFPYLNEDRQCIKECTAINLINRVCFTKNQDEKIKDNNVNNIKNAIISNSIESILDKIIYEYNDILIIENNIKYQITSSFNQNTKNYNNISTINLGECENILKENNDLTINDSLLLFKIDYFYEGYLTPIVIYEIYNPKTKAQLNLDCCKNNLINISFPVNINENELVKYNPSNSFYKDICITYTTENGTDLTLNDRKNEYIDKNLSLCENDNSCNYSSYDFDSKKVICKCFIKINLPLISEIIIDKNRLMKSFIDIKMIINLKVLKCYKKLFTKEGILNNPGNFILLSIILINIISYPFVLTLNINDIFHLIAEIIKFKTNQYNKKANIKQINIYDNKDPEINKDDKHQNNKKKNLISKRLRKISNINFPPKKNIIRNLKGKRASVLIDSKKIHNIFGNNKIEPNSKNKKSSSKTKSTSDLIFIKFNKDNNNKIKGISNNEKSKSKSTNDLIFIKKNNNLNNVKKIKSNSNNKKKSISRSSKDLIIVYNNKKKCEKKKILKKRIYEDYELNNMSYKKALLYDKRTFLQYYWSILKVKHIFIYIIFPLYNDYNSKIIKACLFLFTFALYFVLNALFFDESTIHEIYLLKGEFNFIYHISQKIYSTIISIVINIIIKYFSLSSNDIIRLKNEKYKEGFFSKSKYIFKCIKIKFNLFFIISIIFLAFFWFYISCLFIVYKNTKIIIIEDTIIGFCLALSYPFFIYLASGLFRVCSLKKKSCNLTYRISKLLQLI